MVALLLPLRILHCARLAVIYVKYVLPKRFPCCPEKGFPYSTRASLRRYWSLAAGRYPGHHEKGKPIAGLKEAARLANVCVFHTEAKTGDGIEDASHRAYDAMKRIQIDVIQYRNDIATRALRG